VQQLLVRILLTEKQENLIKIFSKKKLINKKSPVGK
jgi:hypothetical protein